MSAWVGLAELALGGCTTTTDHLYVHPRGGGDLISAEIAAARELGMRFHPTRGLDEPVGEGRRPAARLGGAGRRRDPGRLRAARRRRTTTRRRGAMVRIALAPCSPFSVTPELMTRDRRAGRAARRPPAHPPGRGPRRGPLRRRALRQAHHRALRGRRLGAPTASWVAHCIYPNDGRDRPARAGRGRAWPTARART